MAVASLERRLKGAHAYFIPFGETVDSGTVSSTSWPDNDPTTNWTNYSAGCIERVQPLREFDTEELICPKASGGYEKQVEQRSTRDGWICQLNQYNQWVTQLEYGLASAPVAGTPQTPFASSDRYIDGVLLIQARGTSGTDHHVEQWHARMRLATVPDWTNATSKPVVEFQVIANDLNTFEIPS